MKKILIALLLISTSFVYTDEDKFPATQSTIDSSVFLACETGKGHKSAWNSASYKPGPYSGQESLLAAYDEYYLSVFNKI